VQRRASSAYCGRYFGILVHHVDRHVGHVLGDPRQDGRGAALDVVRHDQVANREILAPIMDQPQVLGHRVPVPRRAREGLGALARPELEVGQPYVDQQPQDLRASER
jgi:hypothetical protein